MIQNQIKINETQTIQLEQKDNQYITYIQENHTKTNIQTFTSKEEALQHMLLYVDKTLQLHLNEYFQKQTFYTDLEEVLIYYYNTNTVEALMENEDFLEEAYEEWCLNDIQIASIEDFQTMIYQISQPYKN